MYRRRNRRMASKWLAAFTVLCMTLVGLAVPASAAEINDAVTDVRVTTSDATIFADVNFEVDWTVPNGSSGGDFFTLELPAALDVPDSLTFDLADPAGAVIAVATVSNGLITFTLTDAVNGQNNISGTAFITAGINQDAVAEGAVTDLTFVTAGGTFDQDLEIVEFVPDESAGKFVRLLDEPTENGNGVISGITTRLLTIDDVGATVTIIDTPGPGLALDCTTISGSRRDFPAGDSVGEVAAASETCEPTSATITFEVTPEMADHKVRFSFELAITDPDLPEYTNNGSIDIAGEATEVAGGDSFLEAGGAANADTFDLALIKQLADGTNLATVAPGDAVTFTITIENQGAVDAANIEVTDFVPAGLTLADDSWTDNGDGSAALSTPIAALGAGESTTVDINFTVDADAEGTIDNFAEISAATDANGTVVNDIDSTPDAVNDDLFETDDDTTGNGLTGGDEDDHDRAQLEIVAPEPAPEPEPEPEPEPAPEPEPEPEPAIFDLALIKQLTGGTNLATVAPGDTVTFMITVVNQGEVDAANIEIVDFVADGLTLADSNWTAGPDGIATLNTPIATLAAGARTSVNITLTVDADASGTIDNFAEISGATDADGNPVTDVDSIPDAINNDLFTTDDDITGDGINGGDEDDSDRAQINVEIPVVVLETVEEQPALAVTGIGDIGISFLAVSAGLMLMGMMFLDATGQGFRRNED